MIPSILALAEMTSTSGPEAITAYIAGFETQYRLALTLNPSRYEAGWHATATFGVFGAAAATANLVGLNAERTRCALTIAASMPAGLKRNFGTMTKPMHAAQAARSGITAALLAREGFTADPEAIGGERGFWELYAGNDPLNHDKPLLDDTFAIVEDGIYVKKYPCCYGTHRAIEATRRLVKNNDIVPQDVDSVTVRTSRMSRENLPYDEPSTGLEAKFSMHHVVDCAIALDYVGLDAFKEGAIDNPEIKAVREKVNYKVDPEIEYTDPTTKVSIELTDGAVVGTTQERTPGSPEEPISDAELREKFERCACDSLRKDEIASVFDFYDSLCERSDVTDGLEHLH